jgi:hypothetical protein
MNLKLLSAALAGAALLGCGAEDLKRACAETRPGEPFRNAQARLDRTGARHYIGPPTCVAGEHLWQKQVGFGGYSCYVTPGPAGEVASVKFTAGN